MPPKKRIVFVDDEADLRKIVGSTLEPVYEVETFAMGDQALASIRARLPDLVILDVHLPQQNGLEVCEQMRQTPQMSKVPVLFMSGRSDPWTIERAKRAGGDGFLAKPFGNKELLERIKKLIGERGA